MSDSYATHQASDDRERRAVERLSRVHGATELHAALLALLLPKGSRRAARAWKIETAEMAGTEGLREHAAHLSGATRLPWFERLLERMSRQPMPARQGLLRATRRVMGARGLVRPIDRLHWLAMRRGLGEATPTTGQTEVGADVVEWLETDVLALAVYTAFLSRMVIDEAADEAARARWYAGVMRHWQPDAEPPPFEAPDSESVFEALARLQSLSWMQRPVVMRSWVAAALKVNGGVRLDDAGADALRLTCLLLDSPQPPELTRHYVALAPDGGV